MLSESFRRAFRELLYLCEKKYISKHQKGCMRERACVCVSLLTTTNGLFSSNCKKNMFLLRKFANTCSTKALRDSAAVHKSQPTPATLLLSYMAQITSSWQHFNTSYMSYLGQYRIFRHIFTSIGHFRISMRL